ncbi:MAG: lytic transglycosylase domain-containing protein [Campylobacterota bacterium]
MKRLSTSLICSFLITVGVANTNINPSNELPITHENFNVSLSWLKSKPKSYAKDFFIIQFLNKEDISKEDAKEAYEMAKRKNGRVKRAYKRFEDIPVEDLKCYKAKTKELFLFEDRCLALGLSLKEATRLSKKYIKEASNRIEQYPTLQNDLEVMASVSPFLALLETYPHRFYRIFFDTGEEYRLKEINYPMPQFFIDKISEDKSFNEFVRYVVPNPKYDNIQKSLFEVKDNSNISHQSMFFLAMNLIRYKKLEVAKEYLEIAFNKAYFRMDKDKVLFWQYLLNSSDETLQKLSNSWDVNIYSIYAKEKLNKPMENLFYEVDLLNKETTFDITNQFEWIKVLRDIKENLDEEKLEKYKQIFSSKRTAPHYAYLLERYHKYKKQYFITPYKDVVSKFSLDNQVLIYAIARQESRYIPSAISFATAQGMMQIMPFLSKAIAKQYKEPYNIYEQFIPEVNLTYANRHLNVLKKSFKNNPLFIAYAYNGGPGYTKSQFRRGHFQDTSSKFEPYLSMELISYNETRRYGKKVLANYYIYYNHLQDKKIKLSSIFETLNLQGLNY